MNSGDRGRIRTFDRLLRRQMLYPAELRDRLSCCEAACPYEVKRRRKLRDLFCGCKYTIML